MELVLIGAEASKRTKYFREAANEVPLPVTVLEWDALPKSNKEQSLRGAVVKIDPPAYSTVELSDMRENLQVYRDSLKELEQMDCIFLNSPKAIGEVLDKRSCKIRLQEGGVPVTKLLSAEIYNVEQLFATMEKERVFSVFLKPVFYSGAAGVVAFRMNPRNKKMMAYTSCKVTEGKLVNTKTLYCIRDEKEILALLNAVISLDVMVERWHPKSTYQEKGYDLRVVYQFGHIAHVVVRQSKGPITNLHLNNMALDIQALGLDKDKMDQIEAVCGSAMALFPGLSVAGIDILLEKDTQKPLVIEMNGQGDLIYQDIYGENRIYREQISQLVRTH